jgi:hypothetical protein
MEKLLLFKDQQALKFPRPFAISFFHLAQGEILLLLKGPASGKLLSVQLQKNQLASPALFEVSIRGLQFNYV